MAASLATNEFRIDSDLMNQIAVRVSLRKSWVLLLAFPIVGFALARTALSGGNVLAAITGGAMFAMPVIMVIQQRARIVKQTAGSLQAIVTLAASESAVEVWIDGQVFKRWEWNSLLGSQLIRNAMVMATPDGGVIVAPKSAFKSPDDWIRFGDMVQVKLSVGGSRPDAIGAIP